MSTIPKFDPADEATQPDRRKSPRRSTLVGAKIVALDGDATFECIIRNLSDSGALLVMPNTTGVPETFYLAPPTHDRTILCRAAWRDLKRIGVEFLSEPGDILGGKGGDLSFRPPL